MKYPGQAPFDAMLEQSLRNASRSLDGDQFRIRVAARIAAQKRRMRMVRLLPVGMGLVGASMVSVVARMRFDFHGVLTSLVAALEKSGYALGWVEQVFPGVQGVVFPWILLAGMALLFSIRPARREPSIFQL